MCRYGSAVPERGGSVPFLHVRPGPFRVVIRRRDVRVGRVHKRRPRSARSVRVGLVQTGPVGADQRVCLGVAERAGCRGVGRRGAERDVHGIPGVGPRRQVTATRAPQRRGEQPFGLRGGPSRHAAAARPAVSHGAHA